MNAGTRFSNESLDVGLKLPSRRMSLQSAISSGGSNGPPRTVLGRRGSRRSSLLLQDASDITFSEGGDSYTTDYQSETEDEISTQDSRSETSMSDKKNPFVELKDAQAQRNMPRQPIRKTSMSFVSVDTPKQPTRRASESLLSLNSAILLQTIAEKDVNDSPPGRPTRLESVVDSASSHGNHSRDRDHQGHRLSLTKQLINAVSLKLPTAIPPMESMRSSTSTHTSSSTEPTPDYLQEDFAANLESQLEELQASATKFRSIVKLANRKYGMRSYKNCFVGSQAVDKMLEAGLASSRTEAVELGRSWMTHLGLFSHVCDAHMFKDKYLFYTFNAPPCQTMACSNQQFKKRSHSLTPHALLMRRKKDQKKPWYLLHQKKATTIQEDEPMQDDDHTSMSQFQYPGAAGGQASCQYQCSSPAKTKMAKLNKVLGEAA